MHADRSRAVEVVVVGAGIGGLAAALRCAAAGVSVAVFERADAVGGKMRTVEIEGRSIDVGPTVMTLRSVFDALFEAADLRLDDFVTLQPLHVLARHAWTDGARLDLLSDVDASRDAIGRFAGADAAAAYARFHRRAARIWETVRAPFVEHDRPGLGSTLAAAGVAGLGHLARIDWHRTLWSALGRDFRDPRLRQLFARYATYYGSSPMQSPATLALIAAVEQAGVWRIEGGMIALARGLHDAIVARGGAVHLGAEVAEIAVDADGARGIRLADGTTVRARTVIVNASPHALVHGAFGPAVRRAVDLRPAPRSLSALTVAAVGRTRGMTPAYHTVLFSDDYPAEFEALFRRQRIPDEPTIYLCAPDRVGPRAPDGDERLFVLVNAPATGDTDDFTPQVPSCIRRIEDLAARCGLHLSLADPRRHRVCTPNDFARLFPHTGGALYGAATHSALAPMRRPATRTAIPHLHLVGGGVHPGAGVPMVALGGRHAAAAALQDLRSTSTFPAVGTRGGTSTASATTASWRSP